MVSAQRTRLRYLKKEEAIPMSENCTHDCNTCGVDCESRKPKDLLEKPHAKSHIKHVIGIASGKGGVGKSLVTSLLAVSLRRAGFATAILDADITGPSIPKSFGIRGKASGNEEGIFPARSATGIAVMSTNLLLEKDTDPVIWRGPVIAGMVKQFWTDVIWGDIDFLFVDLPPGTGDVPLTVYQSIPMDGVVVVASAQELVGMIVEKAVNMAEMMNIPVMGLVENMSGFTCPDCGKTHAIFGESHIGEIAARHGIDTLCKMAIDPKLAAAVDAGTIELFENSSLDALVAKLQALSE